CRAAFEFRHESWFDDEVLRALSSARAALCWAEDDELAAPHESTAAWGYLRLRRSDYSAADLGAWAERIRGQAWSEAYAFFKHEDEGTGRPRRRVQGDLRVRGRGCRMVARGARAAARARELRREPFGTRPRGGTDPRRRRLPRGKRGARGHRTAIALLQAGDPVRRPSDGGNV